MCILFGCCHTQISNLKAKSNFENMFKIGRKLGQTLNLPDFWIVYNIFAKLVFAFKFNIWVWQHPNNMHIILLKDERLQRLQNQQKHILQQKMLWLRRTCHMPHTPSPSLLCHHFILKRKWDFLLASSYLIGQCYSIWHPWCPLRMTGDCQS